MGKYQNTWSHRTKIIFREIKIIFHPFGNLAGFPARAIVLWQENARGTQNASLAGDRYNGHSRKALVLWVWFLNVFKTFQWTWDMFASSILHVCIFLVSFGIIKHLWHAGSGTMKFYSPTSMLFPSGVALREYDIIGRIHFHISLTSMQYMYIIHLALCRHLNIKLVDKLS
jgi:hypothetical protein